MRIPLAKGNLVHLVLLRIIYRTSEIVMDMAMRDEGRNRFYFGDHIQIVIMRRQVQMTEIKGHAHIAPGDPPDLFRQRRWRFRIAVRRVVQVRTGVLHGDDHPGKGVGGFLKDFCFIIPQPLLFLRHAGQGRLDSKRFFRLVASGMIRHAPGADLR